VATTLSAQQYLQVTQDHQWLQQPAGSQQEFWQHGSQHASTAPHPVMTDLQTQEWQGQKTGQLDSGMFVGRGQGGYAPA